MSSSPLLKPSGSLGRDVLLGLEPVPVLLARVRAELSADFQPGKPLRVSRAPGRLDVMGGVAGETGAVVCLSTTDRGAAVALQPRDDREVQVFSFNRYDDHVPFTFRIPLDALAANSPDQLRRGFQEPGRPWAAPAAGCLAVLHGQRLIDLSRPDVLGVNLAVLNTVPPSAGLASSAAETVAAMINVCAHFGLLDALDAPRLADLCRRVEIDLVGKHGGIDTPTAIALGEPGSLVRMVGRPAELKTPVRLPAGVRVVGIHGGVKAGNAAELERSRVAAAMAHRLIVERMRQMGQAAGKTLDGDPTDGCLANVAPEDYKRFFRPYLPEWLDGQAFLDRAGAAAYDVPGVAPQERYPVQHAADHHVLEANRVRNFVSFLEAASALPAGADERRAMLDKAGHLMYASHLSYTHDAMLGSDACDLLVQLVREREFTGLYGARVTAAGGGGTVAVLCDEGPRTDEGVRGVLAEYQRRGGIKPEAIWGTSPGAWHTGTTLVET